eukprot:CAMPEP_0179474740 /NCGR_PEP_ID=MMETSP0799-20121207/54108_1 /TAXON_ID=46947 /ORGANISM="Geminigera cryophila, Strain CCMP2564" /LENGTH=87 /DNA_ID=CAMNT_0021283929 /DNA_START=125 /DNA_END=384 /DNA_ORIENTATION=-
MAGMEKAGLQNYQSNSSMLLNAMQEEAREHRRRIENMDVKSKLQSQQATAISFKIKEVQLAIKAGQMRIKQNIDREGRERDDNTEGG